MSSVVRPSSRCGRSVSSPGDTVAVSAAAGGVGTVVVQLLRTKGAPSSESRSEPNHAWLSAHGVTPVAYGEGLAERLTAAAPHGIDAFIDLFGPAYVQLAIDLGIAKDRVETIISFEKAHELGTKAQGSGDGSTPEILSAIAELVASGDIEIPIATVYPLKKVHEAYAELEKRAYPRQDRACAVAHSVTERVAPPAAGVPPGNGGTVPQGRQCRRSGHRVRTRPYRCLDRGPR